jgi:hypothetical protein
MKKTAIAINGMRRMNMMFRKIQDDGVIIATTHPMERWRGQWQNACWREPASHVSIDLCRMTKITLNFWNQKKWHAIKLSWTSCISMSSDTSNKALALAISAGGLYVLGQTAIRYGARRLGALIFGGTAIGAAFSLLLLFDALSATALSTTDTAQVRGDATELEEVRGSKTSTCLICQRSASDFYCKSGQFENSHAHAFCKTCFNIYANQGLLDGGFVEQEETSPSGRVSGPGELPCPMFSQGCSCSSLPTNLLRNHLTPENIQLWNDVTERIALNLSLESLIAGGSGQGIRQRVVSWSISYSV